MSCSVLFCFFSWGLFLVFFVSFFLKCVCGLIWISCGGNAARYVPCTLCLSFVGGHVENALKLLYVLFVSPSKKIGLAKLIF